MVSFALGVRRYGVGGPGLLADGFKEKGQKLPNRPAGGDASRLLYPPCPRTCPHQASAGAGQAGRAGQSDWAARWAGAAPEGSREIHAKPPEFLPGWQVSSA